MTARVWAALVVSTVALVYLLRLDRVAGLMVDDAWYILLAKALAGGDGYRLISSATDPILPTVPPGFPALLAPVFALMPRFPANLFLLKAISIAAMAGVGLATYHYAVRRAPKELATAVAVATVLTPSLVFLATSTVMPEAVFTLAQILTIILLDRGDSDAPADVRRSALAGVLAAVTTLTRTAGVAALAAGLAYLIYRRAWRSAAVFAATAMLCLAPWWMYSAAHAPTAEESARHGGTIAYAYSDLLAMRRAGAIGAGRASLAELPARASRNLVNVLGREVGGVFVPGFYRGPGESGEETVGLGGAGASMGSPPAAMVVSFTISALLLVGLATSLRAKPSAGDALVLASAAMILMLPTRTFRYLLPLAPFLWGYLWSGLRAVTLAAGRLTHRDASPAPAVMLLSLVGLQLLDHGEYLRTKAQAPAAVSWLADAQAVDDLMIWMDRNLPPGAPVAATNPGLVYLRTGRKAVVATAPAASWREWQSAGIRFIVALQPAALPPRSLGFKTLYQSSRLWVVEIPSPDRTARHFTAHRASLDNY
ncbi:MAG: hypothetical protein AB7P34_04020 [Vicinamibacterales bacterium]